MGSKNILKKSVFGGFKKEDVINYVEQLQQEIVNLKRELGECNAYKRDFELMKNEKEKAEKDLASQREENFSLKSKNSELIEMNASLNLKNEEMQVCVEECERKLCESAERAAKLEHDLDECESNFSKIREAERIVAQAKATALSIKSDAKAGVESAKAEAACANDRIKTACVNFESAAASLKSSADILIEALDQAADRLEISAEEA